MTVALTADQLAMLEASARAMLPNNATRYELSLVGGMLSSALQVPIGDLWNADRCPIALLPFLAWAFSVDVWDEAWPEEVKRSVVRNAIPLHRIKGTLEGIRRHVRLAGGEVVRAVLPPAKLFLGQTLTPAERRAFLANFPEIRITSVVQRGHAGRAFFPGPIQPGPYRRNAFLADAGGAVSFPADLQARERFGRRGLYVDGGVSIPLAVAEIRQDENGAPIDAFERLVIPGRAAGGYFTDAPRFQRWLGQAVAAERVVSLSIVPAETPTPVAVRGGLMPISVEPETIRVPGENRWGAFCGRFAGRFFVETRADVSIYQSIRLHDTTRAIARRKAFTFLNADRFGMDAFTAELDIAIRGRRPRIIQNQYMTGFLYAGDREKEAKVYRAIVASKAARDTILVNTKISRPPTLGNDLFVGQVRVGEFVRG
ncbi:phage tail protein I [Kaistia sp. MMO-174]|uniref:phage tail protein I n=1 Tax=Kaistia sp. MMO-174 TaxID=3081256 RepID=UPI00301A3D45